MFWKVKALTKQGETIWRTYHYRSAPEVRAIVRKSGWTLVAMTDISW